MKIAQVLRGIGVSAGGVETGVIEISKRLMANGHESLVYGAPLKRHISIDQIQDIPVRKMVLWPPFFSGKDIDLIHWHQEELFFLPVKYAAKQKKIPYIATIHTSHLGFKQYLYMKEKNAKTTPEKWLRHRNNLIHYGFYKNASALLCVDQEVEKMARQLFPQQKIICFPNGVDVKCFANGNGESFRKKHRIPLGAKVVLCLGRISEPKNQLFLVKAFSEIKKRYPSAYLLLVGPVKDFNYQEKIMKQVFEDGIQDSFSLLPAISLDDPELIDAYHSCDVFVLPSKNESFGIVILEAWATGKPVIASRIGGIPDLIQENENGLLFELENKKDLIEKILYLWSQEELAEKFGRSGQAKARASYDWDLITNRLIAIYQEVLEEQKCKNSGAEDGS